jgi:hypothetical protein
MTTYIMSTTIIPSGSWGNWTMAPATIEEVGAAIADGAVSAVGHGETASVISTLTNQPINANRITVKPQVGDIFFCFSLKQRPPEAAVLSRSQLEAIGYQWARMEYKSAL